MKGPNQNKIKINKENGDETEWKSVVNKKSVKRNECNILENKKVIETNNRYCILEDYQEETPSDINNPFGVDFNILNKANNNGSFINNQSFMQSDSYAYQADLTNNKKKSPKKKEQQQNNALVAGHRKKATEFIGSKDRERENSKVVTPRKNIVPGNRSYASATKYGKKVLVIGDSHLRNIK